MRTNGPIVAAHLAGNALLMASIYYWLGIGESSIAALAWSVLVGGAIVCLTCWLHGTAFAYFAMSKAGLRSAWRTAARRLGALAAAAVLVAIVYWLLMLWANFSGKPAFQIASWLTLKLRRPVRPAWTMQVFSVALWLVRWMVVPVLVLPVIGGIAESGWRGAFRSLRRRAWYWIAIPALLVCALWIPARLWNWVPVVQGFGWEMFSFVTRMAAGYLLFLFGWLGAVRVTMLLRQRAGVDPA